LGGLFENSCFGAAKLCLYGWLWTLKPKRAWSMKNILYFGLLGLDEGDVEVVRLDDFEPQYA